MLLICDICASEASACRHKKCQEALETYLEDDTDKRNYAEFIADQRDQIYYIAINENGHYVALLGLFEDKEGVQDAIEQSDRFDLRMKKVLPRSMRL